MRSELTVVIKMVDEVVKPLLNIKEALESTHGDFTKVQKELSALSYQLVALYDCFDKTSKSMAERSTDLETLEERFEEGLKALESIPSKIDKSVQLGIRGAANDLKAVAQYEIQTGIEAEVRPAVQGLNQAVKDSLKSLNAYEAMTSSMHLKIVAIAVLSGMLMGAVMFYSLSRKIGALQCDCFCMLEPEALRKAIEKKPVEKPEEQGQANQPKSTLHQSNKKRQNTRSTGP